MTNLFRIRMQRIILRLLGFALTVGIAGTASADTFVFPDDSNVIGAFGSARAEHQDTLLDIARNHSLGYNEIRLANEYIDTWLPGAGQEVVLPKRYILPATPHEGLVLNIPEMRLYFYPDKQKQADSRNVVTYPLGIGRQGWGTPYVTTSVTAKVADPAWYPPESIREEHAAEGDPLPKVVPAGPDNPLGTHAMRLALPSYLIHGTNKPWGVGMRVSHGCIRLYPEHIEALFKQVDVGTTVRIVNQPYKTGLKDGILYLEAHPVLEEDADKFKDGFTHVISLVLERLGPDNEFEIDWELARQVTQEAQGVPIAIGMRLADPRQTIVTAIKDSDSRAAKVATLPH